jgi:DNA-binding IclR family transcriptional regulator
MKATSCSASSHQDPVVKSAARTLEILEYFDEVRQPLNVVGVADALGYPQSSAAALLRSLTAMGYLHYNRRKRTYVPTDRVPFLGSWINPPLFENGALPRLVRTIQKRTGQLVVLAARNGDMAQYIHVLNEPTAVEHHIKIGQKRPLATSGVGQVLLSAMLDKDIKRLYHRMNAYAVAAADKIDIAALLEQLTAVRLRGYTFSRNRVVEGYGVIAVPVPRSRAYQPLALGIGGHCDMLEQLEPQIVEVVRQELRYHLEAEELAMAERPSIQLPVGLPAFAAAGNTPPTGSAA